MGSTISGSSRGNYNRNTGVASDYGRGYSGRTSEDRELNADKQAGALEAPTAAPSDPYSDIMTTARAQADANTLIRNQAIRDAERTRSDLLGRTENWYGQLTGSNAPAFAHMLPAYNMHGIDVMGGNATGWDQYAALAGVSGNAAAQSAAGENMKTDKLINR